MRLPNPAAATVHVVLPRSGRSLCGCEEEHRGPGDAAAVPCPECSALLRSGLLPHRGAGLADRDRDPGAGGAPRRAGRGPRLER
jgi:hypothetical protein